jgi:hypothetical protein
LGDTIQLDFVGDGFVQHWKRHETEKKEQSNKNKMRINNIDGGDGGQERNFETTL